MFLDSFFKTALLSPSLLKGSVDYHSHILPGMDDGVKDMEQSLSILARFEQLGVAEVWCTPHIMEDIPNKSEILRLRFEELQKNYNGPIRLHLAAEYMLDNLFSQRLAEDDLLPIGETGNHLLVETSYFNPPCDLQSVLRTIQSKGYFPVLAHPERYVYMDKKDYQELKDMGVKFQLNITSLAGAYGKEAQEKSEWLLKSGYYQMHGSDIHSEHRYFREWKITNSLYKKLEDAICQFKTIKN